MSLKIIETRRYAPQQTVIREGDQASEAYTIRSGTAAVLKRNSKGEEVPIAVLEEGEIFGEMGLILDRPRSATVRARTALVIDVVDPTSFTALFDGEAGRKLRPIIQILSERLRVSAARLADLEGGRVTVVEEDEELPGLLVVRIVASTSAAKAALGGRKSVQISKFPFLVGRQHTEQHDSFFHTNDLYLADTEPFHVSQSHFALSRSGNVCYLEDRGSRFGCLVNGKRVGGGYRSVARIELKPGENTLRVGSRSSRLLFRLVVQKTVREAGVWDRLRGYLFFAR